MTFFVSFQGKSKRSFSNPLVVVSFSSHQYNGYKRPFNNPTETYRYYSLPFCKEHSTHEVESAAAIDQDVELRHNFKGDKIKAAQKIKMKTGETFVGDRRESSPYEVSYDDSVEWRLLCKMHLVSEDLQKLKDAINNNYFFEMFVEDLPMWGYLGDILDEDMVAGELMGNSRTYLFTHLNFIIGHNNNQIVSAKVTTDVSVSQRMSTLQSLVTCPSVFD